MTNDNKFTIESDDFVIRVRPFKDASNKWNGEIDIATISQPSNDLDDDDYYQVMHFCKMVASTVPLMESEKSIRDLVHDYVVNVVDNEMELDVELEEEAGVEKTYDGNVVHLSFNSGTKGNA